VALWGDSFAPVNAASAKFAVPLDVTNPNAICESNGDALVRLASAFELNNNVRCLYTRGRLDAQKLFDSPYVYYPHEAIVPGVSAAGGWFSNARNMKFDARTDGLNRAASDNALSPAQAAEWVLGTFRR
jgi:hypothetical protein